MLKPYLYLSILLITLSSCQSSTGERDIRNYYFPLKELTTGLVYEFEPTDKQQLPVYWYYRSLIQEEDVFLTATYYEHEYLPLQQLTERMADGGMIVEDLFLYADSTDSNGQQQQVQVDIIQDDVFPFRVKEDGSVYLYHARWEAAADSGAMLEVIKNRQFAGDTTFVFEGKNYPAVKFNLKELFAYDKEGVIEQQYNGMEIYAKQLGLVYWRKEITADVQLEYRLKTRYPMEQLEEKYRSYYQIE